MRWTIHLDGGPRRVNHAAVAIGDQIFSFGGYSSEERFARNELIDVHILDTRTYRWRKASPPARKRTSMTSGSQPVPLSIPTVIVSPTVRSSVALPAPAITVGAPPTGATVERAIYRQAPQPRRSIPYLFALSAPVTKDAHGRRRTIAELHPLGQLRSYRPPLEPATAVQPACATTDSAAGVSPRSFDSGFDDESENEMEREPEVTVDDDDDVDVDGDESEHDNSLIHAFRRQRAATVDITAADRRPDNEEEEEETIDADLRQHLDAFAADIRQIQAVHRPAAVVDAVVEEPLIVDQMARDFDELGPMDVDDYYYGEAPGAEPPASATESDGDGEGAMMDEDDEYAESLRSDYIEEDFEDFGAEDDDSDDDEDYESEADDEDRDGAQPNAGRAPVPVPRLNFIDVNDNEEVYDDFELGDVRNDNAPANPAAAAAAAQLLRDRRRSHQNNAGRLAPLGGEPPRRRAHSLFAVLPPSAPAAAGGRRRSRQYVAPFHRYGHTVVEYCGKAYLWGGRNDEQSASTVLHVFDPATRKWSMIRPATGSFEPPARDGHSAVVHEDTMYIFGGFEERYHRFSQETYAFHFPTAKWKRLNTEGELPLHRDFHTACVLADGRMYVFGGRSDENGQFISEHDVYCARLWALDLKTLRWTEVKTTGEPPCGRRSHSIWTHNGMMYLFGGFSGEGNVHYNDIYVFDPIAAHWSVVRPSQGVDTPPSPRRRQCTVAVGDRVFLFGGTMPNDNKKQLRDLADLYVLDYAPSLLTLSAEALLRYNMGDYFDDILPYILQEEIQNMSRPNSISHTDDEGSCLSQD